GQTAMLLRESGGGMQEEGMEALLVDQIEMAGGTVAEHLKLPFVSVAAALPVNLDPTVPPCIFPWSHRLGFGSPLRNPLGHAASQGNLSGMIPAIDRPRRAWGLPPSRGFNAVSSPLAQVSQLPAALELPGRRLPPHFHHTGPWMDPEARGPVDFPWSRLDPDRPLAYA